MTKIWDFGQNPNGAEGLYYDSALSGRISVAAALDNSYQVGGTDVAVADGGTGASTAAAAATALGVGTGDSPQFAAVNIGHATDTTLARDSAGVISVEGSVLAKDYEEGTFVPTFTFATPGDLSVAYTTQTGFYTRIGNRVLLQVTLIFTPTYTTSSGNAFLGGFPFTAVNTPHAFAFNQLSNMTYGASALDAHIQMNATTALIAMSRSANTVLVAGTGNFPSGTQYVLRFSGQYQV